MLAISPSSNIQERFQTSLFTPYDATTDGLCTWLLGMTIDRKPCGVIHLHHDKYINDILTTFNMTECTPRRLPCTPDTDFHDPTCAPLDTKLFPYPNLANILIGLTVASRPDIAFVVGRLHGLIFRKQLDNGAPDFIFFVDADWATFMPTRLSTTGYLALVHGTPVASRAQVQIEERGPTAEEEFVALCMACKCLAFIHVLLRQLSRPTTDPVRVCEDNQACIVQGWGDIGASRGVAGMIPNGVRILFKSGPPAAISNQEVSMEDATPDYASWTTGGPAFWLAERGKTAIARGCAQFLFFAIKPAWFYLRELHDVLRTKGSWSGRVKMTRPRAPTRPRALRGRQVLLHEDNMGLVHLLANLTSRSPMLMTELRKLWFILDSNDISIRARYIKTMANFLVDRLSREIDYDD
eukprot:jgi/Tetstr1/449712/TSEL_036780.t1